jgi:hypothetical protein
VVGSGQTLIVCERRAREDNGDGGLTVAIPLKVERNVMGIVAIFRLLAQKPGSTRRITTCSMSSACQAAMRAVLRGIRVAAPDCAARAKVHVTLRNSSPARFASGFQEQTR